MALVHGRNNVILLDGDDLSAFSNSTDTSEEADSHNVTVFGNDAKVYQSGLTDSSYTIEGFYDNGSGGTAPSEVIEPLLGGDAVTFIRRPEGTGTGLPERSVSVIVTGYDESQPVDDMITFSVELQGSGDITRSTQA